MSLEPRNFTMGQPYAADASTKIPTPPIGGTAYRNTHISDANIRRGQAYKQIWESGLHNEINYRVTAIAKQVEEQGFLTYSPLTNYLGGVSIAFGSNGVIYIATQNSGPKHGGDQDPVYSNGYWESFANYIIRTGGGTALTVVGEIRLLPFHASELPGGWYLCNGDRFMTTTPQGQALNGLSTTFKANWGIISGETVSLPNLFHSSGDGAFMRAVNGTARRPGTWELDQFQSHGHDLRNGGASVRAGASNETPTLTTQRVSGSGPTSWQAMDVISDGTNGTPRVGDETRPLNVGMTPAIYLGV